MAKRFTDSDKWKKAFIKSLPVEYKLFWLYLLDDCDFCGIWHVGFDVAELRIGLPLVRKRAEDLFEGKIVVFDDGEKWFIPDFIEFQYGTLNEQNRMHRGVLSQLHKYKLKPLQSPIKGAKDKDKDKDKDKEQDKEQDGRLSFDVLWELYDKKVGDKAKLKTKWDKLTTEDRQKAINYIPFYKNAQPDKQYRKNLETFLNNKSWNDELYAPNVIAMGQVVKAVSVSEDGWVTYDDGRGLRVNSWNDFESYKAGKLDLSHFDRKAG
jgi:hypothetical protein